MTCAEAREEILDLARDVSMPESVRRAVEQHLGGCATCAAEFGRQRDLTVALGALTTEAETWKASPAIEERLREAFVARLPVTPRSQSESKRTDRWIYALAGAAVMALAVWLGSRPSTAPSSGAGASTAASPVKSPAVSTSLATEGTKPAPSMVEAKVSSQRPASVRAATGRRVAAPKQVRSFEFVTLPAAAGLPDLESGSVVRIAVPVGALPEYGFDIAQVGSKTTVDADVLVGQDGLARAIRLVSAEESATQDTRSRQ